MKELPIRFLRFLTAVGVLALFLISCSSGNDSANINELASNPCASTPTVVPQQNYPIFEVASSAPDEAMLCNIMAHYEAGYAIVSSDDIDPWNDPDPSIQALISSLGEGIDSPPDGDILHQVPLNPNASIVLEPGANGISHVFAQQPHGNGEPWECSVVYEIDPDTKQNTAAMLEGCLTDLRDAAQSAPQELYSAAQDNAFDQQAMSASQNAADMGQTVPDPRAWTSLGTLNNSISFTETRGPWYKWAKNKVGTATAAFTVYRLNSTDSQDFYLVRGQWSLTPNFISADRCYWLAKACTYYNNEHKIGFSLQRVRGQGATPEHGQIHSHAPHSVVRKKNYSFTVGSGLKAGGKVDKSGPGGSGEGSINASVSTSYSYDAANVTAKISGTQLDFHLSHASSNGFPWSDLYHKDPTTVGGITVGLWGLFSFTRNDRDKDKNTSLVLKVHDFSGNFGTLDLNQLLVVPTTRLLKYKAQATPGQAFSGTFSLPHFSVLLKQGDQKTAPPYDARQPLKIKRGETIEFFIDAGGPASTRPTRHPITLNWKIDHPAEMGLSRAAGYGTPTHAIQVTANQNAPVDNTLRYLRFNTDPPGAAPGLQEGSIAVPILIVE